MDDAPRSDGGVGVTKRPIHSTRLGGCGPISAPECAIQLTLRLKKLGILKVHQTGLKKDLVVRRMRQRVLDVGHADVKKTPLRGYRVQRLRQLLVTLRRQRGQYAPLVPEVVAGRCVRNANVLGEAAQIHCMHAIFLDGLGRGLQDRAAQVAMVIGHEIRMNQEPGLVNDKLPPVSCHR